MSLSNLYTEWALKLHAKTAQAAAAVYVGGIQDQALNNELSEVLEGGEESIYRSFGALAAGNPGARCTSKDLKTLLDACGVSYMTIDADGTHPGVAAFFQKYAAGAARAATGAFSAVFANGILVPRTIELPSGGTASMQVEVMPFKSGSTAPVVFDESAAIPAGVYPELVRGYTLGPLKLSGTAWEGVERVTIEPGIELVMERRDSDIYPTVVAVARIVPVITAQGAHLDLTSTLTEDGKYYAASSVVLYARKRDEGATFVADGTAEHIKWTLGKCRVNPIGASGNPKALSVRIVPWYTPGAGAVSPLAVSTASAIT